MKITPDFLNNLKEHGKIDEVAKYIFFQDIEIGKRSANLIAKFKSERAAEILIDAYINGFTFESLKGRFDDIGIVNLLNEIGDKYILYYSDLYETNHLGVSSDILNLL